MTSQLVKEKQRSVSKWLTLKSSGQLERSVWVENGKRWQTCSCLDEIRFKPRDQKGWEIADWSGGCVRRTPLDCKNGSDGFIKYSMSLAECEAKCLKNCTCMAYANTDLRV
uniref:G-type lectin S-receptor-like serine/threonine-protein kinase At4g27290 n=1 Tax=Tanacetum cinerariifolium TaxID=118510 RepID=A0A6L2N5T5_TANCI|nr:G-type lectin S-receptor-like serine/threonine-protein kinase At4g27290 [Tanacetum cinerariifolium]